MDIDDAYSVVLSFGGRNKHHSEADVIDYFYYLLKGDKKTLKEEFEGYNPIFDNPIFKDLLN